MNHKEAVLVSAYTRILLTKNFADVQKFCEELLGRPIFTHEFVKDEVWAEIREKCRPMILEMIQDEEE